jgi:polysaccharide pyruvyl transferase CsaB
MKILMATMSLGIGGAETHIVELASELKRRGADVMVASNGGVYVPDIEANGIRHFDVPMNRRSAKYMLKSFFLMRRIIKQEKPDIVHAHARIPAFILGLLRKTMRFTFVTTAHWVFDTSGSLRYLTNWGQKTIAVSDDIKEYLIKNYNVGSDDIQVTINGIDTDKFSPETSGDAAAAEFQLDRTRPVVTYVSRLDEDRALVAGQLIEIAPALDRMLSGVQIVIAGGGTMYETLREKAEEVNRAARRRLVTMTGPRTDISEIIAAGDLFVGVSRAALEAMAAAKPVILAGNEGYLGLFGPEKKEAAAENNYCCRGSEESSDDLLLGDILRALRELTKEELHQLGVYGRQVILSDYSVSRMTDDYMKVYEAIRRRRYNVVMSGYYGFGNAGDEAILQSIHTNIEGSGDVSVTVLSNDPEDTKTRYGYKAVNRFKVFQVFNALRRCDALVSGGGSLLQDHTSTRSLMYYLYIIKAAELMGKKVMIYANGIGPVEKKANRRRVRRIISKADVITLRDEASALELQSIGVKRTDIHVTADPVFTLDGIRREHAVKLLQDRGFPANTPFVCVSIRKWSGPTDFCEKLAALCDEIHERYGQNIVFIAMQSPNDSKISHEVQGLMKSPSVVLDSRYSAEELMGIIGMADFVLAMRLHTLIFSARMCVPLAGIIYDPKVEAYLQTLSMPSAGYVSGFDKDTAMAAVKEIMENRARYAVHLRQLSAELEAKAREDAKRLVALLEKGA